MAKKGANSSSKKKKKASSSSSKKLILGGPKTVTMKKVNPFETIWSRQKFDIVGRKRKGEQTRTGLARSRANEKRKKTLLKDYIASRKSSTFNDERLGENDTALDEFGKDLLRRERQIKKDKKRKYNLSDGEEDEFAIFESGLGARDDYEDAISEDNEADNLERNEKSSFYDQSIHNPMAAGEDKENKRKSKEEVMTEVIKKSKFYKELKAKDKMENEDLKEQLDNNFPSLNLTEAFKSFTKMNNPITLKEEPDVYDKLVAVVKGESRAQAAKKKKTLEEIAQEEREELEKAEKDRQRRMISNDDSGDEASEREEAHTEKVRSISGDDLGDSSFDSERLGSKKGLVDEILARDAGESEEGTPSDGSESDEGEDEGEKGELALKSVKEFKQSDDEKFGTDSEEEEEDLDEERMKGKDKDEAKSSIALQAINDKTNVSVSKKFQLGSKQPPVEDGTLPYIIEVPASKAQFCFLVENRSDDDILEAIKRIRTCNAISLGGENKKKMQVFYGLLLQYFAEVSNKKPLNLNLLNLLIKPLMEMSKDTPYFAALCARQRIVRTRTQFCNDIKNPEKSCWPTLKTLLLLRLWSMIYSCSDFRHSVMTPAILLMSEYLMRCPIMSGRDIAIGSFLCSLVLSVARQSQKFFPEALIFLRVLLMSAADGIGTLQHSEINYLLELKMFKPWLRLHDNVAEIQPLDFVMVMDMPEESSFFSSDNFRASMLKSVMETMRGFLNIYGDYDSFPEIFLPISASLHEVGNQDKMPDILQKDIMDVINLIKDKVKECHMKRQPLEMCKKKAVPMKQVNPKFEENYVKGRSYDPDTERSEKKKWDKLIKHEAKGAARELRKDNNFLLKAKQEEAKLLKKEKSEAYGKTIAFLQEQEHAAKSGQLGKNRKRR